MRSQSIKFDGIYIDSIGIIVSKKEKEGYLGKYFNSYIDDYYFNTNSFESAQIKLAKASICKAVSKSIYNIDDIQIAFGGDLSNQIFSTTASIKEYNFPFVGNYAACASGILSIILASLYINFLNIENALIVSSSHVCVSQRQFRYPIEYAFLFKDSSTITMTGACSIILSKKQNKIKVSKATIGKVIDILSKNVNDMGTCMAYAAIDTLIIHLLNNKETVDDYDLIVTGDLGMFGSKIFLDEVSKKFKAIDDKFVDCGSLIYKNMKGINAGASGPTCIMCVTFSYIINKMLKNKFKKVLVIATGALHSDISSKQKQTIPSIAHAIVLEVS